MAINFLDNIQLNQNQLLGARLENVTSDPGSALGGDIIFNSTSNILKYYNGSAWISLTADTQGMVNFSVTGDSSTAQTIINGGDILFQGGTGITTGTSSAGTLEKKVTITNNLPFNGLTLASTTGSNSTIADSGTITIAAGTGITTTNNASGQITIAATGSGSMSDFILTGDSGDNQTISDGDTLDIAGGTNITTVVGETDTVTVNLDDSITLTGDLTVSGGDIILGGTGRIQGVDTVTDATDAASKAYVDSAVAGGLNVKGGFNANTGAITGGGNLTSGGSRVAIAIGDYYVVTTAGNFFGNAATPLTVGDSVLVQTAAAAGASVEGDFAVIQSDTDLATALTVGIGNVNVNGAGGKAGLTLSYASGTATVGVDIQNQASTSTALSEMAFLVYDGFSTGNNLSLPIEAIATYVNTVNSKKLTTTSQTTHTFTHNLNTFDVIVQLYDTSSKETVYANVDRTSVNVVTATTASSASLTALITKIG